MATAKESVQQTLDHLPDQASWDDIMYELYVKQKIEKGLQAAKEDRVVSHEEAKKRLLGTTD
ncbi:MAG: hypothetical protein VW985_08455 [Gammaproteobacteria bacterium]